MTTRPGACLLGLLSLFLFVPAPRAQVEPIPPGQTTLASPGLGGVPADGSSIIAAISEDGRYVAFESVATNLVPDDTNDMRDVFVRDRELGATIRVSLASDETEANGESFQTTISGDGRYVAFTSFADNLFHQDLNLDTDVFVRDVEAGVTYLVSVTPGGEPGNNNSAQPFLSHDGRYVAFASRADDLVTDDLNKSNDIFVRDLMTGTTELISVTSSGEQANDSSIDPALSPDGRFVVFYSSASNLVADDTNGVTDIFLRDRQLDTTELVSRNAAGVPGDGTSLMPSVSADGRFVAFFSSAANFSPLDTNAVADSFIKDRLTGEIEPISVAMDGGLGNGPSDVSIVSADGRFVCFGSVADNLVPGDINDPADHDTEHDVFLRDRLLGTTTIMSVDSAGVHGDKGSIMPVMTPDARVMAFETYSTNLVPGDTNGKEDIIVHDLTPWTTIGGGLAGTDGIPTLEASGLLIKFTSGELTLSSARPLAPAWLLVSNGSVPAPFKGGQILALPALLFLPLGTDAGGGIALPFTWQPGVPPGAELWFQFVVADDAAPQGYAISTCVAAITP